MFCLLRMRQKSESDVSHLKIFLLLTFHALIMTIL